jgi:hypothetical protein
MKLLGKLAGVAAIGMLLYGTSYFTRDRADPSWSAGRAMVAAVKPAEAARVAETQAAPQSRALASAQDACAGQTWPNISPECVAGAAGAAGAKGVRVIGPQGGPVPGDRLRPVSSTQASVPAKAQPAKVEPVIVGEPVRAAAADPDSTGSVQVTPEPVAQIVPAAPVPATLVQRRAPKHAHAARRANRCGAGGCYASMPAPALRQAYYPAAALPTYREPIQFRLADRSH